VIRTLAGPLLLFHGRVRADGVAAPALVPPGRMTRERRMLLGIRDRAGAAGREARLP
jgi:hypothetical protein